MGTRNTSAAHAHGVEGESPQFDPNRNFRFYDNRQKYLLFVNTCAEKWAIADRIAEQLATMEPRPPALRIFDAGVGDGTVLTRVMRRIHQHFPTVPLYVVGKEISVEDVRLALEKMSDRFVEHPATVLVLTNLYYKEAPWLQPHAIAAASQLQWKEVELTGHTSGDFESQITSLLPYLTENWRATVSEATGNPAYVRPTVLVLYRRDQKFQLHNVLPKRSVPTADYDLVIASQPYRLRAPLEFKASRVLAPLAKSLAPGGRLLAFHSHGNDPGLEILQGIWPDENPFVHDRHQLLEATRGVLGQAARGLRFGDEPDGKALLRYAMHTLPGEVEKTIGTSTAFAAWNAAVYVGQIEDQRLEKALASGKYLEVTREVIRKHSGLWFWDECYSITRAFD